MYILCIYIYIYVSVTVRKKICTFIFEGKNLSVHDILMLIKKMKSDVDFIQRIFKENTR